MASNKHIFKLNVNSIDFELDENREDYLPLIYPFEYHEYTLGYFSSLEKAEEAMWKEIRYHQERKAEDEDYDLHTHSYSILEYVLDKKYSNETYTHRSYLPNGKLEEFCPASQDVDDSTDINHTFRGRKPEEIRFAEGDIVEVLRGKVYAGIVMSQPLTVAEVEERDKKSRERNPNSCGWYSDASEDHYHVLVCKNRENIVIDPEEKQLEYLSNLWDFESQSVYVFPPTIPVPEELRENLKNAAKQLNEYMEEYWKTQNSITK